MFLRYKSKSCLRKTNHRYSFQCISKIACGTNAHTCLTSFCRLAIAFELSLSGKTISKFQVIKIEIQDFSVCNYNFLLFFTFQVIGNIGTNGWRNTSTPRITTPTSYPFWSQTWIMCEQTTSFMLSPNRERYAAFLDYFYLFFFFSINRRVQIFWIAIESVPI